MTTGRSRFLFMLLGLLAWFPWASAAKAARPSDVPLRSCVARAAAHDDWRAVLRADARFECGGRQTRLGAGDFWVRIGDLPASAGTMPVVVRSLSLWQKAATLRFVYADGRTITRRIDNVAAARSIQLGAIFEQPIPVRGVPLTALLWRIEGSANMRGILAQPVIAPVSEGLHNNLLLAASFGAFGGLCFALIVYNLSLWAVLRHRFQLAYCVMVAMLAGYALTSSGALGWLWPELGNTARIRGNYLFLGGSAIAATVFARFFFEPRVFAGWAGRAATLVSFALGVSSIVFALFAPWQARALDMAYAISFFALMIFSTLVLARAWRIRSNYLWVFAIGWAAPLLFAALRVATSFQLLPINIFIDNSTLFAMAMEAVASSVAITYRIRLLLVERDEALARELVARSLADTDPLTGLLNRRAFLRDAIGGGAPYLLVLADVDHFKRVNETLGHDGGDDVLQRVAAALRAVAPPGSLVARLGGEEFALLAPATATSLPDQVAAAVRGAAMPFDVQVTVSVGSGEGPLATEQQWTALYRVADQALFAAKAAGRDRVRRADLPLAA